MDNRDLHKLVGYEGSNPFEPQKRKKEKVVHLKVVLKELSDIKRKYEDERLCYFENPRLKDRVTAKLRAVKFITDRMKKL